MKFRPELKSSFVILMSTRICHQITMKPAPHFRSTRYRVRTFRQRDLDVHESILEVASAPTRGQASL